MANKLADNKNMGSTVARNQLTTVQRTAKPHDIKVVSQKQCFVPIAFKDANSDQQIVAQFDGNNIVLPGGFLKLQSSVANSNIQQLSQKHVVSTQMVSNQMNETKSIFTTANGQNLTITHHPVSSANNSIQQSNTIQQQLMPPPPTPVQIIGIQPMAVDNSTDNSSSSLVQLTTLQNVQAPHIPHPLPSKSGITIQRIKTEPTKKVNTQSTSNTIASTTKRNVTQSSSLKTLPTLQSIRTIRSDGFKTEMKSRTSLKSNASSQKLITKKPNQKPKCEPNSASVANSESPSCSICDKVFKRKEHLAQHMKLHLGLRPFKCDEAGCNKSFSRKEHLMRHVISHTGKKMFSCEYCQKLFSRKDNLNKHKR